MINHFTASETNMECQTDSILYQVWYEKGLKCKIDWISTIHKLSKIWTQIKSSKTKVSGKCVHMLVIFN